MDSAVAEFVRIWADKSRREEARRYARYYVEAHRNELAERYSRFGREELVGIIGSLRQQGMEEERIVTDMWLLSEYEPQLITGRLEVGHR